MPKTKTQPALIFLHEYEGSYVLALTAEALQDSKFNDELLPILHTPTKVLGSVPREGERMDTEGVSPVVGLDARMFWVQDHGWYRWACNVKAGQVKRITVVDRQVIPREPLKFCGLCGELKELSAFHKMGGRTESRCADCRKWEKEFHKEPRKKRKIEEAMIEIEEPPSDVEFADTGEGMDALLDVIGRPDGE